MAEHPFSLDATLIVFKALFDDIANPAMNFLARDYTVLWANRGMAMGVQRSVGEMIGKPCYHGFRRREEPCSPCLFEIVSETGRPFVGERVLDLPGREREYAEVRAYPVPDPLHVDFLFEIIIPLTGTKKEQEQHRQYVGSLERTLRDLVNGRVPALHDVVSGEPVHLTSRETEVLRLIAKGFSNREIASILGMSPDTAKTHIKNIFLKLDVTDRAEAAVWASVHNLV